MTEVEKLKFEGNNFFKNGNYTEAIAKYTKAISLEPDNPILYSNRSAAYCKNNDFIRAEADGYAAYLANSKTNTFSKIKIFDRIATALQYQKRYNDAIQAYNDILEIDPNNENALKQKSELSSKTLFYHTPDIFSYIIIKVLLENPETARTVIDPEMLAEIREKPVFDLSSDSIDPRLKECCNLAISFLSMSTFDLTEPSSNECQFYKPTTATPIEFITKEALEDELTRQKFPIESISTLPSHVLEATQCYSQKNFQGSVEHLTKALTCISLLFNTPNLSQISFETFKSPSESISKIEDDSICILHPIPAFVKGQNEIEWNVAVTDVKVCLYTFRAQNFLSLKLSLLAVSDSEKALSLYESIGPRFIIAQADVQFNNLINAFELFSEILEDDPTNTRVKEALDSCYETISNLTFATKSGENKKRKLVYPEVIEALEMPELIPLVEKDDSTKLKDAFSKERLIELLRLNKTSVALDNLFKNDILELPQNNEPSEA